MSILNLSDVKDNAIKVLKAWNSLEEGDYSAEEIQTWLVNKMAPSIKKLRKSLNDEYKPKRKTK